jgi:pilus assembly protein CpaB
MKNAKAILMFGVSLLAGAAAAGLAIRWVSNQTTAVTTPVVVAARDIDLGTPLSADMLKTVEWPKASALSDSIGDSVRLDGRVLNGNVRRGEPIVEARLAPVGAKGGLSAVIAEGNRAITVKVNEVIGVAGFALPGNYVDILVNTHDDRDRPLSKIVLERILVLAVAQEAARDETKPKVVDAVTLQVTPEQAEKIDLARSVGSLSLVLRNQTDGGPTVTAGARKEDLLKIATVEPLVKQVPAVASKAKLAPPAPVLPVPAPMPPKDKVEIIKGVQRSDVDL